MASSAPSLVVELANKIPAEAHMARRPFRISFNAKSFFDASVFPNPKGLKPNSPGARSPDFFPSVTATPLTTGKVTEFKYSN